MLTNDLDVFILVEKTLTSHLDSFVYLIEILLFLDLQTIFSLFFHLFFILMEREGGRLKGSKEEERKKGKGS